MTFPKKRPSQKAWLWALIVSLLLLTMGFAELSMGHRFLSALAWGILIGSVTFISLFAYASLPSLIGNNDIDEKSKPDKGVLGRSIKSIANRLMAYRRFVSHKAPKRKKRAEGFLVASLDDDPHPDEGSPSI